PSADGVLPVGCPRGAHDRTHRDRAARDARRVRRRDDPHRRTREGRSGVGEGRAEARCARAARRGHRRAQSKAQVAATDLVRASTRVAVVWPHTAIVQRDIADLRAAPSTESELVDQPDLVEIDQLSHRYPTAADYLKTAESFIGVPYLWGGTTALGLDCSGFVQQVYRLNGVALPRDADQQAVLGRKVEVARAGDLMFF